MRWKVTAAAIAVAVGAGVGLYAGVFRNPGGNGASGGSPSGLSDGIAVHGSWTIEVRDADGTLRERRSFENRFSGVLKLDQYLVQETTVGHWAVGLVGLCTDSGHSWPCRIDEPDTPGARPFSFHNLRVSRSFDANRGGITLAGSAVASRPGPLREVQTYLGSCEPDVAPNVCTSSSQSNFTSRELDDPIPVRAGQQVSARVTIRFESG